MAYILPSTKAKRVKRIDQHGQEELEADDKVAFQQSADAAAQVVIAAAESEAENAEAEQAPAAATPREVIEQLSAAKGELDIVLDLINLMEAQKYLGVANVALSSNIQQKQQQQAIRLQQKVSKLKDAGSRLRRGSAALKARSVTDHLFFVQLGQLQQHWNLKRSAPGSAGHFQIDVALPLGSQWQLHRKEQQPDTLIDVIQAPDGTVQLQSAGLPLPDQALRWLTPLPRPLHTPSLATNPHLQAPSSDSPHAEGTDTVMQDAQPPDEQQMRQQVLPQQQQLPQASTSQQAASTDPTGDQHATQAAAADAMHAGPASMKVDNPQHAQRQTPSHLQQNVNSLSNGSELQDWLQLPAQPVLQPQMISVSADLQDFVLENVKQCDRLLQGRQEEVMIKQLLQRVKQEVRQVQGPQDMDDGAVELVKKVFSEAALSPIVHALQLRLLRLLLLDSDSQQRHSILAELQYLS
ncbi:TPA: hypothetical protein ACH3X2_011531 [Trebouxia sp. C0005]